MSLDQNSKLNHCNPSRILTPLSDEWVTIFKNNLDGLYYGKRADGSIEPLVPGATPGATQIQISKMATITFADINAVSSGVDTWINILMPNSILANTVNFGGYFDVKIPFISLSAPDRVAQSTIQKEIAPPFDVNLLNGGEGDLQSVNKVWCISAFGAKLKEGAKNAWARFDFDDGSSNPIPNPQNFTQGEIDYYYQYINFQI